MSDQNFDAAVKALCDLAAEDYYSENDLPTRGANYKVYPAGGSMYLKLIVESYGQKSVFGFVVIAKEGVGDFKYGDLLKAASWKAPAKNFIRGNVFDPSSYSDLRWTGIA